MSFTSAVQGAAASVSSKLAPLVEDPEKRAIVISLFGRARSSLDATASAPSASRSPPRSPDRYVSQLDTTASAAIGSRGQPEYDTMASAPFDSRNRSNSPPPFREEKHLVLEPVASRGLPPGLAPPNILSQRQRAPVYWEEFGHVIDEIAAEYPAGADTTDSSGTSDGKRDLVDGKADNKVDTSEKTGGLSIQGNDGNVQVNCGKKFTWKCSLAVLLPVVAGAVITIWQLLKGD